MTQEKYCVEDCGWPSKDFAYECKIDLLTDRKHQGCKSVAAGMNAMDLKRGSTMAANAAVTNLRTGARMISTSQEIAQVGTIDANGKRKIGKLIAEAMEKVGTNFIAPSQVSVSRRS